MLAVRLRAARESKGLTQAQAASELGVSRPLLIAIEKGTRDPSPEEIVRLAEIYDKPVGELLRELVRDCVEQKRRRAFEAEARRQSLEAAAVARDPNTDEAAVIGELDMDLDEFTDKWK